MRVIVRWILDETGLMTEEPCTPEQFYKEVEHEKDKLPAMALPDDTRVTRSPSTGIMYAWREDGDIDKIRAAMKRINAGGMH